MKLVTSILPLLAFSMPTMRPTNRNLVKRGDSDRPTPGQKRMVNTSIEPRTPTASTNKPSKQAISTSGFVKSESNIEIDSSDPMPRDPFPIQQADALNEENETQDAESSIAAYFDDSSNEDNLKTSKADSYFVGEGAPRDVHLEENSSENTVSSVSPNTLSASSNDGMNSLYYQELLEEEMRQLTLQKQKSQNPQSKPDVGESVSMYAASKSSGMLTDFSGLDQKEKSITKYFHARQMDYSGVEEDSPLIGRDILVFKPSEDDSEVNQEEFFTPRQIQQSPTQIFSLPGSKPPGSQPSPPPFK